MGQRPLILGRLSFTEWLIIYYTILETCVPKYSTYDKINAKLNTEIKKIKTSWSSWKYQSLNQQPYPTSPPSRMWIKQDQHLPAKLSLLLDLRYLSLHTSAHSPEPAQGHQKFATAPKTSGNSQKNKVKWIKRVTRVENWHQQHQIPQTHCHWILWVNPCNKQSYCYD